MTARRNHRLAFEVQVENSPPVVNAGGNREVNEGTQLTLNGSFTDANPGDTHTFSWEVTADNGQVVPDGDAQDFTFLPRDDGSYEATFTVTDSAGGADADTATVTVNNVVPAVTAPDDQMADANAPATIHLGSFSDPGDDDPWAVTVNWGDGQDETFNTDAAGDLGTRVHTYLDIGIHQVTVTVAEEGGTGPNGQATFEVEVLSVAPDVTPPDNQTGREATERDFALGSFVDVLADGPWVVTVDWGDGSNADTFSVDTPGNLPSLGHTYADDNTYTVTVQVQDHDGTGAADSATFEIMVDNEVPVVTAPANQDSLEGDTSTFLLGSFTDVGDDTPWRVTVDWGDSSSVGEFFCRSARHTAQPAAHVRR